MASNYPGPETAQQLEEIIAQLAHGEAWDRVTSQNRIELVSLALEQDNEILAQRLRDWGRSRPRLRRAWRPELEAKLKAPVDDSEMQRMSAERGERFGRPNAEEVDALMDRLQRGHGWTEVSRLNVDALIAATRALNQTHLKDLLERWKKTRSGKPGPSPRYVGGIEG